MTATSRDYIGMWYEARAKLGVDDRIDFMFEDPDGKRTSIVLRHRDYDGVAGIQVASRRLGMRPPTSAVSKNHPPPPFWRRWRRSPEEADSSPPHWKHRDSAEEPSIEPLMHGFTPEQTGRLYRYADNQQVSLNSLLLLSLHRAVCTTLLETAQSGSWCFPVNMRGAVASLRQEMNLSSAFYLTVSHDGRPHDIDAAIRANLKANRHWRFWHLARIGRFIGQSGVDWLCARMMNGTVHFGSFSSLGQWQMDFLSAGLPPDTLFCCCGPGSPNHPVANGAIVVNGRLTLALRLHPSLGASRKRAALCFQRWIDELLEWT